MTVAEMSALLYLPGHPRQELARALTIPELSPGWKTSLRALLDQADGELGRATGNSGLSTVAGGPPPAWAGFRPLRVVGVDAESRGVFSVRLASADAAPLPTALPGQFLTLRLHPRVEGPPVIRSYSLSGRPGDADYRISVKQEPHGAASGYLRSHLRAGDTLEVAAPRGTFTLVAGDGPVLLLSADLLDQLELPRTADAYLCGPPAFMRELTGALVTLGLDRTHIHTETFSAEPAQTPGVVATPPHDPRGQTRRGSARLLCPQRPDRQLGRRLRQPARARRGL
jgi:ferredoxin-NADP reductase